MSWWRCIYTAWSDLHVLSSNAAWWTRLWQDKRSQTQRSVFLSRRFTCWDVFGQM